MRDRFAPSARAGRALVLAAILAASAAPVSAAGGMMGAPNNMPGFFRPDTTQPMWNRDPAFNPAQEYKSGVAALKAGQYSRAASDFGRVLEVAPNDINTLLLMGLSKEDLGDLKGAARYYDRALRVEPHRIMSAQLAAVVDARLGLKDRAQTLLDELRKRAAACAGACPDAAGLGVAVAAVEAAIAAAAATPDADQAH